MSSWENTWLWAAIESSKDAEAQDVRTVLRTWIPKIEAVLKSSGTAPTDFTLHDEQHGFRVAQRMIEIVPADVQERLSIFELSL